MIVLLDSLVLRSDLLQAFFTSNRAKPPEMKYRRTLRFVTRLSVPRALILIAPVLVTKHAVSLLFQTALSECLAVDFCGLNRDVQCTTSLGSEWLFGAHATHIRKQCGERCSGVQRTVTRTHLPIQGIIWPLMDVPWSSHLLFPLKLRRTSFLRISALLKACLHR